MTQSSGRPAPSENFAPPETPAWRAAATPLLFDLVLPLALYYALRSQGTGQWQALMFSGALPAARVAVLCAVRRRVPAFEAFMIGMLAVRVVTSLFTGEARILLVKDACLSIAAAAWVLGSLLTSRPFAFQLGQYWSTPAAAHARNAAWRGSPALRATLTRLTLLWGGSELLGTAAGVAIALTCPVEAVPALSRAKGLLLLLLTATATVLLSRRWGRRHGLAPFGPDPLRRGHATAAPHQNGEAHDETHGRAHGPAHGQARDEYGRNPRHGPRQDPGPDTTDRPHHPGAGDSARHPHRAAAGERAASRTG
ncbi:VC0807 family protein [Streptomyces stramineus]|uniref:Integral membrane protein n=1 Tax=Streptomyces stramineus TaxID=173861 RepID=A0ABN1B691_9ACTN